MADTSILLKGPFGVFNHLLWREGDWNAQIAAIDVPRLCETIASTGAKRYVITLMQGSRYMLAPNQTYDRIAGTKPGEACAERDLPMEIGRELQRYGIDLYLYYTGDGPHKDPEIGPKFGMVTDRRIATMPFVMRWASVLREYSRRYGDLVKGWWVDGCYTYFSYTQELLAPYYDACKAGNPDCLVAINGGVPTGGPTKRFEKEDFTCGEYNDFTVVPASQFVDGAQTHILAPLGLSADGSEWNSWRRSGVKRDAAYLADYIRRLQQVPTPLTVDILIRPDGTFDDDQIRTLRETAELLKA